jgi:hypothetical protein
MKRILTILAVTAMAAPTAALAQTAGGTINLEAEVDAVCKLTIVGDSELSLGVLADTANGRLRSDLASSAPSVSTTLDAWCNMPNTMTLTADVLLMPSPGYTSPAGFARSIAYDASLVGWREALTYRAGVATSDTTSDSDAYASEPLTLNISGLTPLSGAGTGEDANAFLEAGTYTGEVRINLAAQ